MKTDHKVVMCCVTSKAKTVGPSSLLPIRRCYSAGQQEGGLYSAFSYRQFLRKACMESSCSACVVRAGRKYPHRTAFLSTGPHTVVGCSCTRTSHMSAVRPQQGPAPQVRSRTAKSTPSTELPPALAGRRLLSTPSCGYMTHIVQAEEQRKRDHLIEKQQQQEESFKKVSLHPPLPPCPPHLTHSHTATAFCWCIPTCRPFLPSFPL